MEKHAVRPAVRFPPLEGRPNIQPRINKPSGPVCRHVVCTISKFTVNKNQAIFCFRSEMKTLALMMPLFP